MEQLLGEIFILKRPINPIASFKSNQIKSFITQRLKFIQYKYHIKKYNPREGKLIWGGQVFIIFPIA